MSKFDRDVRRKELECEVRAELKATDVADKKRAEALALWDEIYALIPTVLRKLKADTAGWRTVRASRGRYFLGFEIGTRTGPVSAYRIAAYNPTPVHTPVDPEPRPGSTPGVAFNTPWRLSETRPNWIREMPTESGIYLLSDGAIMYGNITTLIAFRDRRKHILADPSWAPLRETVEALRSLAAAS